MKPKNDALKIKPLSDKELRNMFKTGATVLFGAAIIGAGISAVKTAFQK